VLLAEIGEVRDSGEAREFVYEARMIDQGFCFNAGEWTFPDAPLRGLYTRNRVYQGVTGMESFAPWLTRLEKGLGERVLDELSREIPPQWYADDYDAPARTVASAEVARPGPDCGGETIEPPAVSELGIGFPNDGRRDRSK
jgi:hypothetical protein